MYRLELNGIEKRFGDRTAVRSTNLFLENGVYGLLGENGAGKTTLMRMICGILKPDKGNIRCDGMDIRRMGKEYRGLLGYLPQDFGYYGDFSVWRFLHYMAALKALPEPWAKQRIEELLELVDLKDCRKQRLRTCSGGMLKRVGIAQALLNEPEILVLDEPTAGLDPKERVRFRNIISSFGKNRIVLLSTHIVSDVDYIADQILIMQKGAIIRKGTQRQLAEEAGQIVWKCRVPEEQVETYRETFLVSNLRNGREGVELRIVSEQKPFPDAVEEEASLEDLYLYFTCPGAEAASVRRKA